MDDAKNLDAVLQGKVQDEKFLETFHPKHSKGFEGWMSEVSMPSHMWLAGEETKRVVRGC